MKAIKAFNGGLWAFRLVFAVVVAELLIVAGAVVGCFEEQICSDADTHAIKETMQGLELSHSHYMLPKKASNLIQRKKKNEKHL